MHQTRSQTRPLFSDRRSTSECSGGLLRSAHVRDENLVSTCALGVLLALSGHKLSAPMSAFADAVGGKADMASASQNVRF